jgi:hypothetical protein
MPLVESVAAGSAVCVGIRRLVRALLILVLATGTVFSGTYAGLAKARTVVVVDDRGGSVVQRVRLIKKYKDNGTRVEIRGEYCLSACTMYLSLRQTCVAPETDFGFHGPSSRLYGIALSSGAFERWSRLMADYYPEPLRAWFLKTARHRIVGFYTVKGSDLIAMGIRSCTG